MKVKQVNTASLSNYEVLQILQEPLPTQVQKSFHYQDFRTAIHTTKEFLKQPMMPCSVQTNEQILEANSRLKSFKLTKLERLGLINNRPMNMVELVVMIEDIESRFNEQEQQEVLNILNETLPFKRPVEEEPEEEA